MISVIGGGPAGSMAAISCAKEHDTCIYEPRKAQDRRVKCSGLISRSGLGRLGIKPAEDYVLNSVRGARIFSAGGTLLEIDGGKDKAYVVDRRKFDADLLEKATAAGARLIAESVGRRNIAAVREKSEKLVIASGTNYNLHRALNLQAPKDFLVGAQYELKLSCDPDYVEMYLDVPGFFSWIIPAGDRARVGLCTTGNPMPYLDRFLKRLHADGRIKDARVLEKNFGIIPKYDSRMKTQYPGIVLVGDAAGQVKATTGGGIVMGGLAAKHVAEADYEQRWRAEIGTELGLHAVIRRALNRLSERSTEDLIRILNKNRRTIECTGDMDMPSGLLFGLVKNPLFMAEVMIHSPRYLWDLVS